MGRFLILIYFVFNANILFSQDYGKDLHKGIGITYSVTLFKKGKDTIDHNCRTNKWYKDDSTYVRQYRYKKYLFEESLVNGRLVEFKAYKRKNEISDFGKVAKGNGMISSMEMPIKVSEPEGFLVYYKNGLMQKSVSKNSDSGSYYEYDSLGNRVRTTRKLNGEIIQETQCMNGRFFGLVTHKWTSFYEKKNFLGIFKVEDKSKPIDIKEEWNYNNGWITEYKLYSNDELKVQKQFKNAKKHGLFIDQGKQIYYLNGKRKGKNKPAGL